MSGDGDGTTPSFIINHQHNIRNSGRSALRSPDPFDSVGFGVEEEDEKYNDDDDDDDGVKEGREQDEKAAVVSRGEGILSEEPEEIIGSQQQQQGKGLHAGREDGVSKATKMMAGKEGKGKPSKK